MLLFDTTQVGLERALAGSAARQSAIATNLANVNTPGYQRQDVNFESTLAQAFASDNSTMAANASIAPENDPRAAMRADGSTTDADTEAAAQAKNGLEYEAISSVLKARNAILRSALGIG
jgi:flagellar basal-body rod protein FlgB